MSFKENITVLSLSPFKMDDSFKRGVINCYYESSEYSRTLYQMHFRDAACPKKKALSSLSSPEALFREQLVLLVRHLKRATDLQHQFNPKGLKSHQFIVPESYKELHQQAREHGLRWVQRLNNDPALVRDFLYNYFLPKFHEKESGSSSKVVPIYPLGQMDRC